MDAAIVHQEQEEAGARPQLSAWLWRPWYAKLWWSAVPVWWAGMAVSTQVDALASFYRGGIAGYLNVLFFPITALMVLGVGYVRECLDSSIERVDGAPLSKENAEVLREGRRREEHNRLLDGIGKGTDMFDPRSGPLWIGNPLNPLNSGYIDPQTGKHR